MLRFLPLILLLPITGSAESLPPCPAVSDAWLEDRSSAGCVATGVEIGEGYRDVGGVGKAFDHAGGSIYGTFGFQRILSTYGQLDLNFEKDRKSRVITYTQRQKVFFIQAGHPSANRLVASAGRIAVPFGLNKEAYPTSVPSRGRGLWPGEDTGVRLGFAWSESLRLDLAGTRSEGADTKAGRLQLWSSRLARTIDLFEGAKLAASYASTTDADVRRGSLAMLVHHAGNQTSLEWVRKNEPQQDFEQIFRFLHESSFDQWAWNFTFEDIRRDSYRVGLGSQLEGPFTSRLRLSLHFDRSKLSHQQTWTLLAGVIIGSAQQWELNTP